MKTVKLDRTHQEDLSEISTLNSNITHNLFTANTPSRPPPDPTSHAPTSQLTPEQINQEVNSQTTQT